MPSWRQSQLLTLDGLVNVVWYGRERDRKREVTQWMDPEFYEVWEGCMREDFDLLGMVDRFDDMISESHQALGTDVPLRGMKPVPGFKNRQLLRKTMLNIDGAVTALKKAQMATGFVICFNGKKHEALTEWQALAELLVETTAITIATQGLQYYVEGSQVGYTCETRHLFRRGNTIERIGRPNEPSWLVNVSGYRMEISGNWDDIKRIRREQGYNLFQMVQLQLNEELGKAVTKGE